MLSVANFERPIGIFWYVYSDVPVLQTHKWKIYWILPEETWTQVRSLHSTFFPGLDEVGGDFAKSTINVMAMPVTTRSSKTRHRINRVWLITLWSTLRDEYWFLLFVTISMIPQCDDICYIFIYISFNLFIFRESCFLKFIQKKVEALFSITRRQGRQLKMNDSFTSLKKFQMYFRLSTHF